MLFLENVSIKICLTSTAKTPLKSYADSAGFDLYADETVLVLPRSGLASKRITVCNGVVDPGFSGEVKVLLFNLSCNQYIVEKGTSFAQIIFHKTANVSFSFDSFNFDSNRNNKGFGSSGVW